MIWGQIFSSEPQLLACPEPRPHGSVSRGYLSPMMSSEKKWLHSERINLLHYERQILFSLEDVLEWGPLECLRVERMEGDFLVNMIHCLKREPKAAVMPCLPDILAASCWVIQGSQIPVDSKRRFIGHSCWFWNLTILLAHLSLSLIYLLQTRKFSPHNYMNFGLGT